VFDFVTFQNSDTIDTAENEKGIVAISNDPKLTVLAYPNKQKGYISVKTYGIGDINLGNVVQTSQIKAHESAIACLAINNDGTLIASASDKVI
jgi:hypothetical protein